MHSTRITFIHVIFTLFTQYCTKNHILIVGFFECMKLVIKDERIGLYMKVCHLLL